MMQVSDHRNNQMGFCILQALCACLWEAPSTTDFEDFDEPLPLVHRAVNGNNMT